MADDAPNRGQILYQQLLDGKVSKDDADAWKADLRDKQQAGGLAPKDISTYWGDPNPDLTNVKNTIAGTLDLVPPEQREATNPFMAGFNDTALGIFLSAGKGSTNPTSTGFFAGLERGAGGLIGSLPAALVGAGIGGAVTSELSPPVAIATGGAMSMVVPTVTRGMLRDLYSQEQGPKTAQEFWQFLGKAGYDTAISAAEGAIGGVLGSKVGQIAGNAGAGKFVAGAADAATFATTSTVVGAALQGHVPDFNEFVTGAVLALGAGSVGAVISHPGEAPHFEVSQNGQRIAANLLDIYAKYGLQPMDVAARIKAGDEALLSEILAPRDVNGLPASSPRAAELQPQEPTPAIVPKVTAPDTTPVRPGEAVPAGLKYVGGPNGGDLDIKGLNSVFSDKLKGIATSLGLPGLNLTSGYRPNSAEEAAAEGVKSNAQRGGVQNSAHTRGLAADISTAGWTQEQKISLIRAAQAHGITGIGIADGDIHLDMGHRGLTTWGYDAKGQPNLVAPKWATDALTSAPLKGETDKPEVLAAVANPRTMTPETVPQSSLDLFRKLEGSGDNAVSSAKAYGRYQITPDTAKTYGIDWNRLNDPAYSEQSARKIIADLYRQFDGNMADIAVAYNAGPGAARAWIRSGRDFSKLPAETQRYLLHGETLGAWDGNWNNAHQEQVAEATGMDFGYVPRTTPNGEEFQSAPADNPLVQAERNEPGWTAPPRVEEQPGQRTIDTDRVQPTTSGAYERLAEVIAPKEGNSFFPDWLNPKKIWANMSAFQFDTLRSLDTKLGTDFTKLGQWTLSSGTRALLALQNGPRDALDSSKKLGDASYVKAFKNVKAKGGNSKEFGLYRIAKRAVGYAEKGITILRRPDGTPDAERLLDAQRIAADPKEIARYEQGNQILQAVHDFKLLYAQERGLLSGEQVDRMRENGVDYVLIRRLMEPGYNPPMPGSVFNVRKLFHTIKGRSNELIVDPVTAEIDNFRTIYAIADNNALKLAITDWVTKNAPKANDAIQLPFRKVEDLPLGRIGEILDRQGNPIPEAQKETVAPFVAMKEAFSTKLGPNRFLVFRDGKPEVWEAADPDLADVVNMQWPAKINPVAQIFTKIAGLARAGITGDLSFGFRVGIHSNLAAAALAKDAGLPFQNALEGIMSVFTKSEKWADFKASGALDAAMVEMDRNLFERDTHRLFEETGVAGSVWNTVKHPIDALRSLQSFLSGATRFGYALRQERKGVSSFDAAMESRTAYLDFQEPFKSAWVQTFARMVPFMHAGFKDVRQFSDAFKGGRALGTLLKASAVITLPTIINYAVNYMADKNLPEGERYVDQPRWLRDMYWVLPQIGGARLKIKKPYVVAFPFSTVPERFMDWMVANDPRAAEEMFSSAVAQMVPPYIPTAINPIVEAATNHSFLTGRPLISARNEQYSNWMQSTPNTTPEAKEVSRALGPIGMNVADISPIHLDLFAREWAGTLPMSILKILNAPFQPASPGQLEDMPFVQSFIARNPQGGQIVDDFYRGLDEATHNRADLKLAISQADDEAVSAITSNNAIINVAGYSRALQKVSAYIRAVNDNSSMTPTEKRQFTDQAYQNMIAFSQAGLGVLDALKSPR